MSDMTLQIFFLLNPLASIPLLFLSFRQGLDVRAIAIRATGLAFFTAVAFVLAGPALFGVFNITLDSFRAAGGIMIALLGLSMARGFEKEDAKEVTKADTFVTVLATPMLTGPATLSYLAINTVEAGLMPVILHVVYAFILVLAAMVGLAYMIPKINMRYFELASRIFGLFLLALGIEMLARGAHALFA